MMPNNEYATQLQKSLKEVFSFREWLNGDHLEYCGCQVDKVNNNHWRLHQEKYLHKQKPISISKERKNQEDLPVTESERTQLRGLIGAMQWPATQSSPHLQSQVSMLAGDVTKATIKTLNSANKTRTKP